MLIPPHDGSDSEIAAFVAALLGRMDALVLTGGAFDIHPRHYGEEVQGRLDEPDEGRTRAELWLARAALEMGLPILGLCGGMQAMAVVLGGRLFQDIEAAVPGALVHEQPTDPATPWHAVDLSPDGAALFGAARIEVNSTHHQAVADPGPFLVSGRAPDGLIEAITLPDHPFAWGVQWHPELLGGPLFEALVRAC